jgi:hypothetical protein
LSICILLLSFESVDAFASKKTLTPTSRLSAANDVVETQEQEVPYAVSRGDGSTGGGGLPMPQQEHDGLMRPKVSPITTCRLVFRLLRCVLTPVACRVAQVGAAMPNGRPSWFRVPGPSQGGHLCLVLCLALSSLSV